MPWYHSQLDPDLQEALRTFTITEGKFLDLGCGSGVQSRQLVKRGFDVTGTDISASAIKGAQKKYPKIHFLRDDILKTRLNEKYNYIFDRGCFHIFNEKERKVYVKNVTRLLRVGGLLFLKVFSFLEPDHGRGPFRYTVEEIETIFNQQFNVAWVKNTIYQGQRRPKPKAIFIVLKKILLK